MYNSLLHFIDSLRLILFMPIQFNTWIDNYHMQLEISDSRQDQIAECKLTHTHCKDVGWYITCIVSVLFKLVKAFLNNVICLRMIKLVVLPNPFHPFKGRKGIA